jgi:tetratricopeptide (TPR) repeat protein
VPRDAPAVPAFSDPLWTREDCLRWSRHPEAKVRAWALEKLADTFGGIPEAVAAERIDDPELQVAGAAISAAGRQGYTALAARILARYRQGPPLLPAACLSALAALGHPRLLEAVRGRLPQAPPEERAATWIALSLGRVSGGEALLLEALDQRPSPGALEVAALIPSLVLAGSPAGLRAAVGRLVSEYQSLREELVLAPLLGAFQYGRTVEDFREDLGPHGAWRRSPLEEAAPRVLEQLGESARLQAFRDAWRRGRYPEVIRHCAEALAARLGDEAPAPSSLPGAFGFVAALAAEGLDHLPPGSQRELAGLAVVATRQCARLIRVGTTPIPDDPPGRLEALLAGSVADVPELEADLIERLAGAEATPGMAERCLRALRDGGEGAPVAADLVARWRPAGGVEALLAAGTRAAEDDARVGPFIEALVAYGEAGLEPIDRLLAAAELPGAMWLVDVLARLPCRRSAAILARQFDRLWRERREAVRFAAESLGARELIEPIRRELREGETETAEVCAFLEALHGIAGAEADRPGQPPPLGGKTEAAVERESLRLALRCRACGQTYPYEVTEILSDPDDETHELLIRDRIRCKGCGRENDHEITPEGKLVVLEEMARLTGLLDAGRIKAGAPLPSPLRLIAMGAFGRRMGPGRARAEYEARIAAHPGDPGLRIGYGNLLQLYRRDEEALAQFREALRLEPLAAEGHLGIAEILEEQGDLAGAIAAMEHCVALGRRARLFHIKDPRDFPDATREKLTELRALTAFRPGRRRAEPGGEEAGTGWARREASIRERTGRNDPCPCGSGRKYKKCCLGKRQAAASAAPPLPADAQARLRDRLVEFAQRVLPREVFDQAVATFHRFWWDPARRTVALTRETGVAFLSWLVFDFRPPGTTETVIQRFHRERGHVLPVDEREALDVWRTAAPGIYEVETVEPGVGLTVVDCFSGERFEVREVRATTQLARWDLVVLRLAQIEGTWRILSAGPQFLPRLKDDLIRLVRDGREAMRRERPAASVGDLLQARPDLFRDLVDRAARDLVRPLHTAEGHPVVLSRATYEVRGSSALLAALRSAGDFAPDPNAEGSETGRTFLWLRRGPAERYVRESKARPERGLQVGGHLVGPDGQAVDGLATLEIGADGRLAVECFSRERLAWAKRRLADLAGNLIRHRADAFESVDRKLAGAALRGELPGREPLPPLDQARALTAFQQQHLMRWLDQAIPALDGRTPRQAAANPTMRARLERVLREMENAEDRKRNAGEDWYDLVWLRAELGMG